MIPLQRLSVCFVAGTLEHGGAERQLYYILRALRESGTTLQVLSLDDGQFWQSQLEQLGVPVKFVGEHSSRLKRLFRIVREVRSIKPDLIQSQHFYANAYAGLSARVVHGVGIGALRNDGKSEVRGSGYLGGWLNLHSASLLAANSRNAIDYAANHGISPSRLHFLANVVDTDRFKPKDSVSPGPITLVAIGRLVSQKRFDRFVEILAKLRMDHGLNVRGLIVGPGCADEDLRPALETQARNLGLTPEVMEIRDGTSETAALFGEAAVCVLTSDHEGSPNVLLEAMSSGLPVVASNVGGVPEIVQHGKTGFLIAPGDLEGFAAALAVLVRNTELRLTMGRYARKSVEDGHSLQRLPLQLEGLYDAAFASQGQWSAKVSRRAPVS